MNCKYCNQNTTVRKGKRNGKQRFFCKKCNRSFQDRYSYRAYDSATDEVLIKLLKEGCGVRSLARVLGISCGTVLSRMMRLANLIKPSYSLTYGNAYEVDEVYVKIAGVEHRKYITYAIERKSRSVIGFVIGGRSIENVAPLINKILLLKPERIYTDKLNIYPSLIPKKIHRDFPYGTNRIERNHLTLRTHVKRLSRRTICFSKKQKYLEAHLKIYFWS